MQCPIGSAMPVSGASDNERFHDPLLMGWRVYYKSSLRSCAVSLQSPTLFSLSERLQNDGART